MRYSREVASHFLRLLFLILLCAVAQAGWGADVVLVLGEEQGVHKDFAGAFQQQLGGSRWQLAWSGKGENFRSETAGDLVVTTGGEALRQVLQKQGHTPVLATLISRTGFERIVAESGVRADQRSVSALFIEQPPQRQMAFARLLLPGKLRLGVALSPETNPLLAALQQAAGNLHLKLETEFVANEGGLLPAMSELFGRTDFLLALPDSSIYRRDSIRAILLTSYRYRKPVIGYSQAFATAGALAALYTSPQQSAQQAAELVKTLSVPVRYLPTPQYPSDFAIAINGAVAQSLELTIPDEPTLRRQLRSDRESGK